MGADEEGNGPTAGSENVFPPAFPPRAKEKGLLWRNPLILLGVPKGI